MANIRVGAYQTPAEYPLTDAGIQAWKYAGFSRFPIFNRNQEVFDLLRKHGLKAEVYGCNLATVNWLRDNGYLDLVEWICGPDEPNPTTYPIGSSQYDEMKLNIAYARRWGLKVMVNLSAWWAFAPADRYDEFAKPYWDDWGADICGMDFYPFYWHDLSGVHPDGDYLTSVMLANVVKRFDGSRPVLWYLEGGPFEDNPKQDIYPNTAPWPDVPKEWMTNCIFALEYAGIAHANLFFYSIDHGDHCKATTYGTPRWDTIVKAVQTINPPVMQGRGSGDAWTPPSPQTISWPRAIWRLVTGRRGGGAY